MYRNTGRETFTLPVNCEQAAALDGRKDFSFGCFVLFFFGLVCDNRTPDNVSHGCPLLLYFHFDEFILSISIYSEGTQQTFLFMDFLINE